MKPEHPRTEGGIKRKWVKRQGGKHAKPVGAKKQSVKNQIRSIERLLKRENIPPKLREEKERELEKLTDAGKENKRIEREKRLSTKYHKVKFFERVKLTRRIEQLEKNADNLSGVEQDELASLKEDLEYVMNFPRGEKYVSVLVKEGDTEHATKERARLRKLVKANLAAAAALGDENEGGAAIAAGAEDGAGDDDDDFFLDDDDKDGDGGSSPNSSSSSSSSSSSDDSESEEREPVYIPKKEMPVSKDPIYIKNHAQKLVERAQRKEEPKKDKDGNNLPQRKRSEGGRKRRKK